jgi:L-glutamine---4-(methylsulfanyl)-2-oxobutanoate aminotransferase
LIIATFIPSARTVALPPNFWGAMDREVARISGQPGPHMIDVSKGNPDLPTPEHIVAAMQRQVADPINHRYPSYAGRPSVRDAVALRYREDHGVEIDPQTEVAIFHGSHEGLMSAVLSLANPGTNVVLPDPGYPMYTSAVDLAQAHVVALPLHEPDYQPDFAALDDLDAARVLLLNYPNNPTGALATRETFTRAVAFAERTGAAFVHDFAYASLGFDQRRPLSALAVDTRLERTVEVQTLSKTYSMAGWRFGFAAGNASLIEAMKRYQAHAFSTMFGATQEAAAAALAGDQSAAADLVGVYERRRDIVVAGLRAIGWDVVAPEGTFFVWMRVPGDGDIDAVEFARRLLEEERVAVAPGDGFGPRGRGHIRVGLVHDEKNLLELIERLDAFTRRN